MNKLILHIPHSGTRFFANQQEHSATFLEKARDLIDHYTDELFSPDKSESIIIPVVFPYCRTVCDVERLADDPLEEFNLGIQYDGWSDRRKHGFLIAQGQEYLSSETFSEYVRHHERMAALLVENPGALVIDCHSFSSHPTALMSDPGAAAQYDICVGYNEDSTRPCSRLLDAIIRHFESCGYRVGINTPFSHSKTFDTQAPYTSVMIEVNKRLYMDERTLEKSPGFEKLHTEILGVYEKVKL